MAWREGGAGTLEEHKLTMTYPIGASVTAALLDAGAAAVSVYPRRCGRGVLR